MILIENIGKSFSNKWAVRGLNIHVERGMIFGMLGPNGAGKTTTIRMMTGLLRPTEGRILINGYDIVKESIHAKSSFGYVPDKAFLYEKLRGREFLKFIASLHGISKYAALKKIDELIKFFGIKEIEDDLIESYSQGMRQRLLFLSALLHDPQVLIIDEPFVGLDPFGLRMLKDMIKRLSAEGVTVFLATHSLHIAEELCNNVGLISKGLLIETKDKNEFTREGGLESIFLRINT